MLEKVVKVYTVYTVCMFVLMCACLMFMHVYPSALIGGSVSASQLEKDAMVMVTRLVVAQDL